jgi:hypothetical protein
MISTGPGIRFLGPNIRAAILVRSHHDRDMGEDKGKSNSRLINFVLEALINIYNITKGRHMTKTSVFLPFDFETEGVVPALQYKR